MQRVRSLPHVPASRLCRRNLEEGVRVIHEYGERRLALRRVARGSLSVVSGSGRRNGGSKLVRKRIVVFIVRYSPGSAISRTIRCTGLIAAEYQMRGIYKLGKAGPRGSVCVGMHVGMGQGPCRPTNKQKLDSK